MTAEQRRQLREALRSRFAWLDDDTLGPRHVDAGECDRCGHEARLVATCGPTAWPMLGRACAAEVGEQAWCDGHRDDARAALAWLARLPDEADDVARLWWVATGEVGMGDADGWRSIVARLEGVGAHLLERGTPPQDPSDGA